MIVVGGIINIRIFWKWEVLVFLFFGLFGGIIIENSYFLEICIFMVFFVGFCDCFIVRKGNRKIYIFF